MSFGILGVAGYIAPRHLNAIREAGHEVTAAMDPHDSVGVLDQYFPNASYFADYEEFVRHAERLRRRGGAERLRYLTICSPNDLHDTHVRLALRLGADAVCEKPLALDPWNLDALECLERETGRRVFTVLQLRFHPALMAVKERLERSPRSSRHRVTMTYVTPRGPWYHGSWKGDPSRSGGLGTNIGIHQFDLLTWLFGPPRGMAVHLSTPTRVSGFLELRDADVSWFLSIDRRDLPEVAGGPGRVPLRSLVIDGDPVDFEVTSDLHGKLYRATIAGGGLGIEDARPSVELVHALRHEPIRADRGARHPLARTRNDRNALEGCDELLQA